VHLGQSRLRGENDYLREVSPKGANRPRLIIIRRDSVGVMAEENGMTLACMSSPRQDLKTINAEESAPRPTGIGSVSATAVASGPNIREGLKWSISSARNKYEAGFADFPRPHLFHLRQQHNLGFHVKPGRNRHLHHLTRRRDQPFQG